MVHPVSLSALASAFAAPSSDFDRLPPLPAAAVQVTPTAQVTDIGAKSGREGGEPAQGGVTGDPLAKALDDINQRLQAWSTAMRFDVDEDSQRVVVSIVDQATGEVLRTVPSDAVIQVARMIVQLQGQSVSTKV